MIYFYYLFAGWCMIGYFILAYQKNSDAWRPALIAALFFIVAELAQ